MKKRIFSGFKNRNNNQLITPTMEVLISTIGRIEEIQKISKLIDLTLAKNN